MEEKENNRYNDTGKYSDKNKKDIYNKHRYERRGWQRGDRGGGEICWEKLLVKWCEEIKGEGGRVWGKERGVKGHWGTFTEISRTVWNKWLEIIRYAVFEN